MTGEITAEERVRRWRPGAEAGDPQAMVGLAAAYLQVGNEAEAELWYARAADTGNLTGMSGLGYLLNRKGARDEAVSWWRRAAGAGDVYAMRNLAGVLRGDDRPEGERWGWHAEAAGRDVTNETVPDEVAEAAADLGPLRSVIGKDSETDANVGCLVLGVVVGLVLAGIGLAMIGSASGWAIGFLVAGGLIVLLTLVLILGSWNDLPHRVWRYEHGLAYRDPKGQLQVARWTDVRVLRDITREYRNGHYVRTTFHYTLRHKNGREVGLSNANFRPGELCVLGEEIEREITAVRLPRALTALQEGQRLEFGNLAGHQRHRRRPGPPAVA